MKLKHMLVLAMMIVLGGCIGRVRQPEINLADLRVAGIGLRGASLVAELDIANPNDFDIETDSITYELFANTGSGAESWASVLRRSYNQRIEARENRTTRVEVPIDFNYSDLSGAGRTLIERGVLNYRIRGHVFVREPLRRTLPFSKTGNVSLSGIR